jgi:hypothetical protein
MFYQEKKSRKNQACFVGFAAVVRRYCFCMCWCVDVLIFQVLVKKIEKANNTKRVDRQIEQSLNNMSNPDWILEKRLQLYIKCLQYLEQFPFLHDSVSFFPEPFFNEEERKTLLTEDLVAELDTLMKTKKSSICTSHDLASLFIRKCGIKKVTCSIKDVKKFLKKTSQT